MVKKTFKAKPRKISDRQYKAMVKELRKVARGFESFRFNLHRVNDWSAYQKRKVRDVFADYQLLASRSHKIFRTRSEKVLKRVQEYAQHGDTYKGFKVAFVPTSRPEATKISVDRLGNVRILEGVLETETLNWDMKKFIRDPETEIDRVMSETEARWFTIITGEHELIRVGRPRRSIKKAVLELVKKYGADQYDPNDRNSKFYGNWLFGVRAVNGTTKQFEDYLKRKRRYRDSREERRRLINRLKKRLMEIAKQLRRKNLPAKRRADLSREYMDTEQRLQEIILSV